VTLFSPWLLVGKIDAKSAAGMVLEMQIMDVRDRVEQNMADTIRHGS
jgi:hypothetical protein